MKNYHRVYLDEDKPTFSVYEFEDFKQANDFFDSAVNGGYLGFLLSSTDGYHKSLHPFLQEGEEEYISYC